MKKIMLATDFSAAAESALQYVLQLNKYLEADLFVLHVTQESNPLPMEPQHEIEIAQQKQQSASRQLKRWVTPYPDQFSTIENLPEGLKYHTESGPISPTIMEVARQSDIDCIVIGAKLKLHWWEQLLGNISTQLVAHSPIPVLVVPQHCGFQAFRHIALASTSKEESLPVFSILRPLAERFDAKLEKVVVQKDKHTDYQEQSEQELTKVLAKSVMKGLERFVEFHESDLLCMYVQQPGFWKQIKGFTLSQELVKQAKVPLLVIK